MYVINIKYHIRSINLSNYFFSSQFIIVHAVFCIDFFFSRFISNRLDLFLTHFGRCQDFQDICPEKLKYIQIATPVCGTDSHSYISFEALLCARYRMNKSKSIFAWSCDVITIDHITKYSFSFRFFFFSIMQIVYSFTFRLELSTFWCLYLTFQISFEKPIFNVSAVDMLKNKKNDSSPLSLME